MLDKRTLTAALWDHILTPELFDSSFLAKNPISAPELISIQNAAKNRFIDSLLQNGRPEHVEFIMHRVLEKKYTPILSIHDGVDHLYRSLLQRQKGQANWLLPYDPTDRVGGCAAGGFTINALGIVDEHGKLRETPSGNLELDPLFSRRVIHETGHILDQNHLAKAYGFSEGDFKYIEARTQDRFHAKLMDKIHGVMKRNETHTLSVADKAALEKQYQELVDEYVARIKDLGNDGRTFRAPGPPVATMEEHFLRLPEKNGVLSERMGKLLERNPSLSHDPVNAYMQLLREQSAEFGGITNDREFIRQFGTDIKDNVITRMTELDYYPRDQRVSESFAKAIDGCNVNLNHADRALPNGRNPIAAALIPNLEEHIETNVYEDLHRGNLQARQRLMPQMEEVWKKAGLNPQEQIRLQQEAEAARQGQGAKASEQQRNQQRQRRKEAQRIQQAGQQQWEAAAERAAVSPPVGGKPKVVNPVEHVPPPVQPIEAPASPLKEPIASPPVPPVEAIPKEPPVVHTPLVPKPPEPAIPPSAGRRVEHAMEDAASHGNGAAKWALGIGAAAIGGWALWELMRRQSKKAPKDSNDKDKIGFKGGANVAVGKQERLSQERALSAQEGMSRY